MKAKSDCHDALSVLFSRDGVPLAIIMDGSKEQTLGNFSRKLHEADCIRREIEPYSAWSNTCKLNIRELKRGSSRKMLKSGSPKPLWDHCLELEARIRSHTAHDIYDLDGDTPEGKMKGTTTNISQICDYEWYEWVMFRDSPHST